MKRCCEHCGKSFALKNTHPRQKFCQDKCRKTFNDRRRVRSPKQLARQRQQSRDWKKRNRKPGPPRIKGQYTAHLRRGYRLNINRAMKLLLIHKPKVCVHCGRAFTQRRKTCSKRCAAAYARSVRLTEKAARRARVAVGSEIDPIAVFIRDGWQCQACGCDTPRSLRGTYEDDAPEIDHTIPLAMDGEHSMDNVQCLCRCCNILKGTSTMQEFVKNYIGNNNLAGRVGQSGPHSGGNRCWPF